MTSAEQRLWIPLRVTSWVSAKLHHIRAWLAEQRISALERTRSAINLATMICFVFREFGPRCSRNPGLGVNPRTSPRPTFWSHTPQSALHNLPSYNTPNCIVAHGDHDFTSPCRSQEADLSRVSERFHQGRTSSSMYCILPHDIEDPLRLDHAETLTDLRRGMSGVVSLHAELLISDNFNSDVLRRLTEILPRHRIQTIRV